MQQHNTKLATQNVAKAQDESNPELRFEQGWSIRKDLNPTKMAEENARAVYYGRQGRGRGYLNW